MARYFAISVGLRGCYMPDSSYLIKADTRRELKRALEGEAQASPDSDTIGLSKRAIASLAAAAWREAGKARPSPYDHVAPYRHKGQDSYPYGLFVSVSNRADYLESLNEMGE